MGVGGKLKRLWRKKKSSHNSNETGGVSSSAPDTPVGSSSVIATTKKHPELAVSSTPLPSKTVPIAKTAPVLPAASAQLKSSDAATFSPSDSFEPWNQAYEELKSREPELMEDYKQHLASLHDLATDGDLSTSWAVESIVKQLLENREKKQWRVSLLGKEVKIREQSERLAKFLLWSSPIVQSAVSTQPYAALAWSGVSLLLPLLTSSTKNNEAMLKGFNSIGDIQVYWEICEKTYLRPSHRDEYQGLMAPLVKLYSHIIEYQARAICHLSSAQLSRAWQDVAGWSDWDGKIAEIDYLSKQCSSHIQPLQVEETRRESERQIQEMQTSQKFLNEIWTVLEESKKQAQRNYEDKKERELLQDLASNYRDYKDFNRRVQGTCEWFFADERFCNWRDSRSSGLLWVSAGPGCGKSVLSQALIDERRLSTQVTTSTICHFFFKDGDERRMHPTNALCAILHQLFIHDPCGNLIQHGLSRHKNYGKNLTQNLSVLWGVLMDCASSLDTGELVCVIDALDECEEAGRRQLIGQLKEFYCQPAGSSNALSKLKFLITSRPYHDIETSFRRFSDITTYLHFDGDHQSALIGNEINLVIDARVNEIARDFEETDRQLISEKLKSMEQRTYLWLHLTFDLIESSSQYSKRSDIEALLSSLPSQVSEAYEKILERSENQKHTEILLQIVLAAFRPLTLDEANEALTLALQTEDVVSYSDLTSKLWPRKVFESYVKNLCGLFISVTDSKLSFIHQTAREFLRHPTREGSWKGRLNMFTSHRTMALVSLRYLSFLGSQDSKWNIADITAKFPLAHYSARSWMDHARPVESEKDVQESILKFFLKQEQAYKAWLKVFVPDYPNKRRPAVSPMGPPLYYASLMNIRQSVKLLLDTGAPINDGNGLFGTALQVACDRGHMDIVQLLLSRGADVEADGTFGNALQIACRKGHIEITQLLLDYGARIDAQGERYGSALQIACQNGRIDIMQLLLDHGADTNAKDEKRKIALQAVSYNGYMGIVQLLLHQGADANAKDDEINSALQAACYNGHAEIVRLLLHHGADANAKDKKLNSALQAACHKGHPEIVQLLLHHGADINTQSEELGSALQAACSEDNIRIVQLLLDHGAYIDAQGGRYYSALKAACCTGHLEIAQLLLDHGANIHAQDRESGDALQLACLLGIIKAVQLLLDNGAHVNAQSGEYDSALQAASSRGYIEIAQLLLDNGADINAQGGRYGSALKAAGEMGYKSIVSLLLARGADPSEYDERWDQPGSPDRTPIPCNSRF